MKLTIDVGTEQRTLVAGIAEAYEAERSSAGRRDRRQPEAREADGHRVERHGARGEPRGRQADARRLRRSRRRPGSTRSGRLTAIDLTRLYPRPSSLTAPIDDRLPLPPRRRGVRRRPRRGRRARAGGRRRPARCAFSSADEPDEVGARPRRARGVAGGAVRGRRPSASRRRVRRTRGRRRPPSTRRPSTRAAPCAVGEIGLDYHYDFAPRDVQREVFAAQVALARRTRPAGRHPHARGDRRHVRGPARRRAGRVRGVMHCFTGDAARRGAALDIGFYISLVGIVTFPKAEALREVARVRARRPAAGRDRRAVSGAGAAPRQAERAGAGSPSRWQSSRRCAACAATSSRAHVAGNFDAFVGATVSTDGLAR